MKSRWLVAVVAGTLVVGMAVGAVAESTRKNVEVDYSGIQIKVDGKPVDTGNSEPFVVVDEGRTYVPARPLAEALKARVGWDADTRTVQVYTAKYFDTTTAGNTTTYSFPYYGASLALPAGGEARPGTSNLLQVDYDGASVVFNRIEYTPTVGIDGTVNAIIGAIKGMIPLNVTSQEDVVVAGAQGKDIIGTAGPSTAPLSLRIRVLVERNNVWSIMALTNAKFDPDGSKTKAFVSGFSIGQ